MEILNRRASFEYIMIDDFTAGMVLTGPEVKSIREGKTSINESFVFLQNGEVYVKNMYVSRYSNSRQGEEYDEIKDKKLLLKKSEIKKLSKYLEKGKGLTAVPLKIFENNGKLKIKIGIGKGRKLFNKKEYKKELDIKKETDRDLKSIKK